ncbi:hypothetical protein J132_11389, partial [Termitomyces sp. J132]
GTSNSFSWSSSDTWKKSSVFLSLPFTHKSYKLEKHAPIVQIDFYHRDLVEVILPDIVTRYCQISPFGHSTICRFWNDVSAMQSFAARDFEDLLQAIEQAIQETIEDEELPPTNPEEHHYISKTKQTPLNLFQWIKDHEKDPAIMNFKYKFNEHLLICLLPSNTEITDQNHGNMIYEHKTLCINYTTYDNQRDQDTLNPQWQLDVMVVADNDVHPYWYFRIVKIFHALVQLNESGQEFQRVEFLWGWWYGFDDDAKSGFAAKQCYQIGFVEGADTFGFVNPADVLYNLETQYQEESTSESEEEEDPYEEIPEENEEMSEEEDEENEDENNLFDDFLGYAGL